MEPIYSIKEIMEIQFKGIDHKLDAIARALKDQNDQSDKQFARLDREIAGLKAEIELLKDSNARYKVIWGIGATLGASLVAFGLNKVF
jgi:hypothetical protein